MMVPWFPTATNWPFPKVTALRPYGCARGLRRSQLSKAPAKTDKPTNKPIPHHDNVRHRMAEHPVRSQGSQRRCRTAGTTCLPRPMTTCPAVALAKAEGMGRGYGERGSIRHSEIRNSQRGQSCPHSLVAAVAALGNPWFLFASIRRNPGIGGAALLRHFPEAQ